MATYSSFLNYVTSPATTGYNTLLDVIANDRTVATFVISNNGISAASVSITVHDSDGDKLFTLLPSYSLEASASQSIDARSINVPSGYQVMVTSDSADVDVCASGVIAENQS
jgi:hypothetical protein